MPSKTRYESQTPLSQQDEKYFRTERPFVYSERAPQPVVYSDSSNHSKWNVDKAWSSPEWKSNEWVEDRMERSVDCSQRASQPRSSCDSKNFNLDEDESHDSTGRPVVCSTRAHQFVIENDEAESELSLGSRSFLRRVNDQVRKRQKQSSKDATQDNDNHSVIW